MLYFDAEEKFNIAGRGDIYTTKNPIRCNDFDWLMDVKAEIYFEGKRIQGTIIGVESFRPAIISVCGASIGLLLKEMI